MKDITVPRVPVTQVVRNDATTAFIAKEFCWYCRNYYNAESMRRVKGSDGHRKKICIGCRKRRGKYVKR